jgi:Ohr subfamily peroxiredoxin
MKPLYTATAQAIGGRNGHVETSDGLLNFDLSIPQSMEGPGKANTTNPEQLFACGYAACFGSAIDFVAKQKKHTLKDIDVTADVSIGKNEQGKFQLAVELKVYLPELNHAQAKEVVEAAHQICPYSSATRGNIEVKLTVVEQL